MARCEICGKIPQFGNKVSHSMRHTRRQFRANIQAAVVFQAGRRRRMKVCARCLRTMAKQ
jgi:large subunit ribosomal protein L28